MNIVYNALATMVLIVLQLFVNFKKVEKLSDQFSFVHSICMELYVFLSDHVPCDHYLK